MATWSSRGCVSVMVIIFVYLENIKKPATNPLGLMAGLKLVFCATSSLHADSPSPDRLSLGERAVIIIVAILAATHAGKRINARGELVKKDLSRGSSRINADLRLSAKIRVKISAIAATRRSLSTHHPSFSKGLGR